MLGFLGAAVSALGSYLGGRSSQKAAERQTERSIEFQREMAQKGIQYRVDDAKQAGIHPLYALGAPAISTSLPSASGAAGAGMADAARSIGNAISARQDAVMNNRVKEAQIRELQSRTARNTADAVATLKRASDAARGHAALRGSGAARPSPSLKSGNVVLNTGLGKVVLPASETAYKDLEKHLGDDAAGALGYLKLSHGLVREYKRKAKKAYRKFDRKRSRESYKIKRGGYTASPYYW